MNNVLRFPAETYNRKAYRFKTRNTSVSDEYGTAHTYPCIALYEDETDIPVCYTGLERYICHLTKSESLKANTLNQKAVGVCNFLNFLLWETKINSVHECTIEIIRKYLMDARTKEDGDDFNHDTWVRYRSHVYDFLGLYYKSNYERFPFKYDGAELKTLQVVKDANKRRKVVVKHNSGLNVKGPVTTHKKNRILVDGYLELMLFTAKAYEPELALGIALGAYAGVREGEVVNLTCGSIKTLRRQFNMVSGIEIDLTHKAPHFENWSKKTDPGSIKKYRIQKVYDDFLETIEHIYDAHIERMEAKGYSTSPESPLFVNKQGRPMTVQSYSSRVKELFYNRFLPLLKKTCDIQGAWAENAAFIETYEEEYPGAHMFRHWFTMYLLTKAKLSSGEIMKWRGDSNQESMDTYIHENSELIQIFKDSSYTFQKQILGEVL